MQRTKLAELHCPISRLIVKVKKSRQNDTGMRMDKLEIPEIDSHKNGQTTEVRRDAMEAPLVILLQEASEFQNNLGHSFNKCNFRTNFMKC